MTTKARTATTEENLAPRLGDPVHFVQTNAQGCNAAIVTLVENQSPDDYTNGEEDPAYILDVEMAYVSCTVFFHGNNPALFNRVAHSVLPTGGTYHTREECRRGK